MKRIVCVLLCCFVLSFLAVGCNTSPPDPVNNATPTSIANPQTPAPSLEKVVDAPAKDELVHFDCQELERIVRETLGIPNEPLTAEDMQELYDLSLLEEAVTSLVGLQYAENLYSISIRDNSLDIGGVHAIDQLPYLIYLNISYSNFSEPISLSGLPSLESLSIFTTNLSDISFVGNLTTLKNLNLSNNPLSDLNALAKLTELEYLDLSRSQITTIEPLKGLSKLKTLVIDKNNIQDISPMVGMTNLEVAILSYNPITNLKPLEELQRFRELTIYQDHDVKHKIFDQVDILIENGVLVEYHK